MKKCFLLIFIFINLTSCLNNDSPDFETGNLWKVTSGEGIESYIFATVHFFPKNELQISKNAILSLNKCRILALEFDPTDSLRLQKIRDYKIPVSLSNGVNALISEYGYEDLVSMEYQLLEIAQENGSQIIGLETVDEKLSILKTLYKPDSLEKKMTNKMWIQTFLKGFKMYREEKIGAIKNEMLLKDPQMMELIINQRNKNWIDDIIISIDKDPTFIAVGVAHLGGEDGLLNLLFKSGYKLENIK